jgi:signal transduction histidine kinase/ActR/RegA family two-component response regulator
MRLQGGWMVSQLHGMAPTVLGMRMTDEQERHAMLAIQQRVVVAVESAADDPRVNTEHLREHGILSVLVAPLIIRNEPFGVVFFNYQRATHSFTGAECNFARQLAATASVALENARLFIELQQSAAALREADERKDVFLATLAHELRNPLAPIRTAAHLLESAALSSDALAFSRGVITRQVAQMAHLLDDLLDIARVTRGALALKLHAVDLKTIVDTAVESARPQIDAKEHALEIQLPTEPVTLQADPIRMTQILTNLLTNAAKYTPPRGRIVVGAHVEPQQLSLFVRDTGIGIGVAMLSKVFSMFVQVNEPANSTDGGLGIGLALVKGLVELHGGSIEARSEGPGRGSEFIVSLPRAGNMLSPSAQEAVAAARGTSTPRRILIADDNRDGVESLSMLLQLSGHEVFVAHCGLDALESCERLLPDVAVLDIGMGDINGYEVAKRIRAQPWGATMRLIAMTGWGRDDDKRAALEAGIDHHLTKPVDLPELERLVGADIGLRQD